MIALVYIAGSILGILIYAYSTHRRIVALKEQERRINKALSEYDLSWKIDTDGNGGITATTVYTKKE